MDNNFPDNLLQIPFELSTMACPHSKAMAEVVHWFKRVLKRVGWLYMLAYILCISFFSVQIFKLVDSLLSPTKTYTSIKEVPLKDIDFPLDIKICVTPSLDIAVLKEFGYDDTGDYAVGASSKSNYSSIGWGGHDQNGRNLTSVREVFNKATRL